MDCHYIKLDATHPDYAARVESLAKDFAEATGGNQLSVNLNKDKTAAWVKVVVDHGVSGPILLADLPDSRVADVRAEIAQPTWQDPPQRGPRGMRPSVPQ